MILTTRGSGEDILAIISYYMLLEIEAQEISETDTLTSVYLTPVSVCGLREKYEQNGVLHGHYT